MTRPLLERDIEAYLVKRVREAGGTAYKFTSPQRRSVPDRIVLMPGGRITFVELKRPGAKPTDAQAREHDRLRALGFEVWVIDCKLMVDGLVARCDARGQGPRQAQLAEGPR